MILRKYWFVIVAFIIIISLFYFYSYTAYDVCPIHIDEFKPKEKPEYLTLYEIPQKEIILDAIREVKSISKRDYEMICEYGNKIAVKPDDIILSKCQKYGIPAPACYNPYDKTIYLSYHMLVDPRLPSWLIHETCHGMMIETKGDYSERPCTLIQTLYDTLTRNETFYCTKITTSSYHITEGFTFFIDGTCHIINNKDTSVSRCIMAYLKDKETGEVVDQTEICTQIQPNDYTTEKFHLEGKTPTGALVEYEEKQI